MRQTTIVVGALVFLFACKKAAPAGPVTQRIDSAGGSISSSDGTVTLTVPAGALASATDITMRPIAASSLGKEFAGYEWKQAWQMEPDGLVFQTPATIRFRGTDTLERSGDSSTVNIGAIATSSNGALQALGPLQIHLDGTTVVREAPVSHFSPVAESENVTGSVHLVVPTEVIVGQGWTVDLEVSVPADSPVVISALPYQDASTNGVVSDHTPGQWLITQGGADWSIHIPYHCNVAGTGEYLAGLTGSLGSKDGHVQYDWALNEVLSRDVNCRLPALTVDAKGPGTVVSTPPGINVHAGSQTQEFPYNTAVNLLATPDDGAFLSSWSGDCFDDGGLTSGITLDGNKHCTVTFQENPARSLTVVITGSGQGTVSSVPAGLACSSGSCSHSFPQGTSVALTAIPGGQSTFTGWSDDCDSAGHVVMDQAHTCTATFSAPQASPTTLSVIKEASTAVTAGQDISYSITLTNTGSATATNVRVQDQLPAGVTLAGVPSSTAGICDPTSGNVLCSVPTLPPSGTLTVTFSGHTDGRTPSSVDNTAIGVANNAGQVTSNSAHTTVGSAGAVNFNLYSCGLSPKYYPALTSKLSASCFFEQTGPNNATNTVIQLNLTGGTYDQVTFAGYSCLVGAGNASATCTSATSNKGGSFSGSIKIIPIVSAPGIRRLASVGSVSQTVTIYADQTDSDPSNNTRTSTSTVYDATLASIAVTPANPSVTVEGSLGVLLTATATMSDGSTTNVTSLASWSSSDTSKVTVTSGTAGGFVPGFLKGINQGSATITASLTDLLGHSASDHTTAQAVPPVNSACILVPQAGAVLAYSKLPDSITLTPRTSLALSDVVAFAFDRVNLITYVAQHAATAGASTIRAFTSGYPCNFTETASTTVSGAVTVMAANPLTSDLYVGTAAGLAGLRYNFANPGFTPLAGSPWLGTTLVDDLSLHPAGQYLAVVGGSDLAVHQIDTADGSLTAVGTPAGTFGVARGARFNAAGTELASVDVGATNKARLTAFDPGTGGVTAATQQTFSLPAAAGAVETMNTASSTYPLVVFATLPTVDHVEALQVDASTRALSDGPYSPLQAEAVHAFAVDPRLQDIILIEGSSSPSLDVRRMDANGGFSYYGYQALSEPVTAGILLRPY